MNRMNRSERVLCVYHRCEWSEPTFTFRDGHMFELRQRWHVLCTCRPDGNSSCKYSTELRDKKTSSYGSLHTPLVPWAAVTYWLEHIYCGRLDYLICNFRISSSLQDTNVLRLGHQNMATVETHLVQYAVREIPARPSPTRDLRQWERGIRSTTEAPEPAAWSPARHN